VGVPTEQLSEAEGAVTLTVALHKPATVLAVIGETEAITGAWLSVTVTVNDLVLVPQLFVAVTETVVTPALNVAPFPVPLPLPVVAPVKA
jgi:hypothetical protein